MYFKEIVPTIIADTVVNKLMPAISMASRLCRQIRKGRSAYAYAAAHSSTAARFSCGQPAADSEAKADQEYLASSQVHPLYAFDDCCSDYRIALRHAFY